jgi:hypothetical protein
MNPHAKSASFCALSAWSLLLTALQAQYCGQQEAHFDAALVQLPLQAVRSQLGQHLVTE